MAKNIVNEGQINLSAFPGVDNRAREAFDRQFITHMVRDHKHDVKAFRKEAKAKEDSPVKVFAQNTLPTLEGHLMAAEKTYDIAEAAKRSGEREVGSKR